MWGLDCNGCDPDLVYHLEGCPLAGELRGKLWLEKKEPELPRLSKLMPGDDLGMALKRFADEFNALVDRINERTKDR